MSEVKDSKKDGESLDVDHGSSTRISKRVLLDFVGAME